MRTYLPLFILIGFVNATAAQSLPDGYWKDDDVQAILDKTLSVQISPDLSHLSTGERAALGKLLSAGKLFHELYLLQRHADGVKALGDLQRLQKDGAPNADKLRKLFWLSKGPIATTLDNKRVAFVPVADEVPGKAVYPPDFQKEQVDAVLKDKPELRSELLHDRSVVRLATEANLAKAQATLKDYPALRQLNPNFADKLESQKADGSLFAVPYSIEYADRLIKINALLNEAANLVEADDAELAGYLRNRSRDLLCSDYEAGDAAWVTGRFKNLNAQIGSYETYDDSLFGVKAFYSMSILARDPAKSKKLAAAIENIQDIEDSLPYEHQKTVRSDVPVHVCNVIADFGQSRGTNTATILPNDAEHSRKYGRTILLRNNIMMHPELFETSARRFRTAVAPTFRDDLTIEANFRRTLWHEVGHYLGVDKTEDGKSLDESLQQSADLLEEMKADLVSLFSAKKLSDAGVYSQPELKAIYAGGILRAVQQLNRPRRTQAYQTMQLIQWNYFLENDVLSFDQESGLLSINYDQYHAAVAGLLREVLAIQRAGDPKRADDFVQRYTTWKDDLHEVIANRLRAESSYRYRYVQYGVLAD